MSNLETYTQEGKTYTLVPITINGAIVEFRAVELVAPKLSPAEPVSSSDDSKPATAEPLNKSRLSRSRSRLSEDLDEELVEEIEEPVEQVAEEVEEVSDDCEIEPKKVSADLVEPDLTAPPATYQRTDEQSEPIDDDDFDTRSESSMESSTGSSTLDTSGEIGENDESTLTLTKLDSLSFDEDFPVLEVTEKVESPVEAVEQSERLVCYKPTYKTLQKVQVRTGPGSKFEECGVIAADTQVFVIQEGLLDCDLKLVHDWMFLHLPRDMVWNELVKKNMWKKYPTFEDYVGDLEAFAETKYSSEEVKVFLKAVRAANRKVKVMWVENGIEKYGWISKKKNSKSSDGKKTKALITRIFGSAGPKVQVYGVSANIEDQNRENKLKKLGEDDLTFAKDALEWANKHEKSTTFKVNGVETTTKVKKCFPRMSFYKDLVKAEVCDIIGSKKARFNVDWDASFICDRFCGLEKQRVKCLDGKTRYRTGYHIPHDTMTISFQRYADAKAFLNCDLDDTRFDGADAELDFIFANEHPVDARMCPEYTLFKHSQRDDCADYGIQRMVL